MRLFFRPDRAPALEFTLEPSLFSDWLWDARRDLPGFDLRTGSMVFGRAFLGTSTTGQPS